MIYGLTSCLVTLFLNEFNANLYRLSYSNVTCCRCTALSIDLYTTEVKNDYSISDSASHSTKKENQ